MHRIMRRIISLGVFLALIAGLGQVSAARVPTAGISYLSELERAIFRFTNEVRQRNGVSPLSWDNSLRDVARGHSADMLVRNYFSHNTPEGRSPHERIRAGCRFPVTMTGENIWMGSGYAPGDARQMARLIVDNWMSSPGHRKNLLHPDYTDIGVGVAARGREVRATQVFVRYQQRR
jgi:uncharacterized protein YkwD